VKLYQYAHHEPKNENGMTGNYKHFVALQVQTRNVPTKFSAVKQMTMSPLLLLDMRLMCHEPLQIVQVSIICTLPLLHLQPQVGHKAKVLTELLLPVQIHDLFSNSSQFHQLASYAYRQNKTFPIQSKVNALYTFSVTVKIT
jgi:hypothetical protein